MTIPAFLFGSLVAAILGALFHVWKGGGPLRIIGLIVSGVIGFWVGHFLAVLAGISFWKIGPIQFGVSLVCSVVFLFLGNWIFSTPVNNKGG